MNVGTFCPKCNTKIKFYLEEIGGSIFCATCKTKILLEDKNNDAQKTINNVGKSLKGLQI